MALEDIFRALEEQADRDVAEVLAEAREHAAAITAEAEAEAGDARARQLETADRAARTRSAQRLNAARLEMRKRVAGVKELAVRRTFDEAMTGLASVRGRSTYAATFQALLAEALEGVSGEFELLVDPADAALAADALAALGRAAPVRPDLSTAGGVVVSLDGGRVLRRNTLEDRLEKYRGLSQADIAEVLFA